MYYYTVGFYCEDFILMYVASNGIHNIQIYYFVLFVYCMILICLFTVWYVYLQALLMEVTRNLQLMFEFPARDETKEG